MPKITIVLNLPDMPDYVILKIGSKILKAGLKIINTAFLSTQEETLIRILFQVKMVLVPLMCLFLFYSYFFKIALFLFETIISEEWGFMSLLERSIFLIFFLSKLDRFFMLLLFLVLFFFYFIALFLKRFVYGLFKGSKIGYKSRPI